MEFRFNLNEIFKFPIVEIGNTLIPPGFSGDKRALWDTQSKITQIVNAMGEASAHAQGLTKPITTADRLRNSEHRLYLLVDHGVNNGKGAVTGMLKTGEKGLYVFDRAGQHYQVSPPCVLDFYIHESRQRAGFGKKLFEHMLQKEQTEPVKMAIDRPSDKLLGFLNKHYTLNNPVKQMNNYVVFDGFFPSTRSVQENRSHGDSERISLPNRKQSANGLQQNFTSSSSSPYGRYGAPRPKCSMGQIIHNDSAVIKRNQEPTGVRSEPITNINQSANNQQYLQYGQMTQSVPNVAFYQNNHHQYPSHQINMYPNNLMMAQGDVPQENFQQTHQMMMNNVPQNQSLRIKEPLIPQAFDGTVKTVPHITQSVPLQQNNEQYHHYHQNQNQNQNVGMILQTVPSAPMNYHVNETGGNLQSQQQQQNPQNYVPQQNPQNLQSYVAATTPSNYPIITGQGNLTTNQRSSQEVPSSSGIAHGQENLPQSSPSYGNQPFNPQIMQQANWNLGVNAQNSEASPQTETHHHQSSVNNPNLMMEEAPQNHHNPIIEENRQGTYLTQQQPISQVFQHSNNAENNPQLTQSVQHLNDTQNYQQQVPQNSAQQIQNAQSDQLENSYSQSCRVNNNNNQPNLMSAQIPQNSQSQIIQNSIEEDAQKVHPAQEVDLSKGYPPHIHQTPICARSPVIVRN